MTLSERIEMLVKQHGSLSAVSRVTGVDAGYLSRMKNGTSMNPSKGILRKLGVTKARLFLEAVSK